MIPLSLAVVGKENTIKRVGGNTEVKRHLENLGVVPGGRINIVSKLDGNAIINVKNSRIAINEEMARKIMV